jgi:hypothetical protein
MFKSQLKNSTSVKGWTRRQNFDTIGKKSIFGYGQTKTCSLIKAALCENPNLSGILQNTS